jgi:hypothetical protein
MVERIVLFKLKPDHATSGDRSSFGARAGRELAKVPGILDVRVCTPADDASLRSWDLLVVLRFDDAHTAGGALDSTAYRAFIEDPAVGVVKAWSFYSTTS